MAVRDIKIRSRLSKTVHLTRNVYSLVTIHQKTRSFAALAKKKKQKKPMIVRADFPCNNLYLLDASVLLENTPFVKFL